MEVEKKKIFKKLEKPWRDYSASYEFWDIIHTEEGGYVENKVEVHLKSTEVCVWQGDDVIYLDNGQFSTLINILKKEGFVF